MSQDFNSELASKLEEAFANRGIAAFTNCCGTCYYNYVDDGDFEAREKGIWFFRLHLDGMNYHPTVRKIYVHYHDFEYLMANWDQERVIIDEYCAVLGTGCSVTRPRDEDGAICLTLNRVLHLDPYSDYSDLDGPEL